MSGVSNLGSILSQQFLLKSMRTALDDTQRQISTGKISTSISGMGTLGASKAISFRNKTNVLDRYTENINGSKARMIITDEAMGSIAESARTVSATLRSQLQGAEPKATILSDEARMELESVIAKLNEQVNGQYVFAGDDLYNAPYANQATLDANMAADVAVWLTGTTPATVVSDARTTTGTGLGLGAGVLSASNVTFMADDNTNIDYTVFAHQDGFADVLRGLSIIANLPQPTTAAEQTNYWNIVNGALELLDEGATAVDTYQGVLGNKARLADDLLVEHSETKATYEEFIGSVEDADMAEASTRLQALQTQMEMSYSVISILKDLSLINYI